jgi:hypothetical protein
VSDSGAVSDTTWKLMLSNTAGPTVSPLFLVAGIQSKRAESELRKGQVSNQQHMRKDKHATQLISNLST